MTRNVHWKKKEKEKKNRNSKEYVKEENGENFNIWVYKSNWRRNNCIRGRVKDSSF